MSTNVDNFGRNLRDSRQLNDDFISPN